MVMMTIESSAIRAGEAPTSVVFSFSGSGGTNLSLGSGKALSSQPLSSLSLEQGGGSELSRVTGQTSGSLALQRLRLVWEVTGPPH